ncbi:hypothetical protein GCM10027162_54550 [Streptomyces incanus]
MPALERSAALFAAAVAYAYLVAGGLKVVISSVQVRISSVQVRDPARLVKRGEASVDDMATELRRWSE